MSGVFIRVTLHCYCCWDFLDFDVVSYIPMGKDDRHITTEMGFDFLPEKVVALASSCGILLCRNILKLYDTRHIHFEKDIVKRDDPKEVVFYVCNPFTKEWKALKLRGRYGNGCCYGFSYDPHGSSVGPDYEVVMVEPPFRLGKDSYTFIIYSSKTGRWRTSHEVCTLPERLYLHQNFSVNGVFYWAATGHCILAFDSKQEKSQVIKLPGYDVSSTRAYGMCMGVSEGRLHFMYFNVNDLMVWVLEDDKLAPRWVLKVCKPVNEMHHPNLALMKGVMRDGEPNGHERPNLDFFACGFQDDILFMRVGWTMCSYNIKTGEIEQICSFGELQSGVMYHGLVLPYYKSILRVGS